MSDPRDDLIRRKKFDPTMCRNCSHGKINHLDCEDSTACLLCEPCEAYQPLGEELARKMNEAAIAGRERGR